jgi:flagellar protein FlbD
MIRVTRLDGSELYVNAELVQTVASTPDTHIVLTNGASYVVKEPDYEVVRRIVDYRRQAYGADGRATHLRAVEG